MKKIMAMVLLATGALLPTARAGQRQFKVLEIDENQTGPYAIFSGGSIDTIARDAEVCVPRPNRKSPGAKPIFCAKIVSVRKRAAAFYIPLEHRKEVQIGTPVTVEIPDETSAEDLPEETKTVAKPSGPLFPPGQHIDIAAHIQATPAIKTNSVSFSPLPRDNTNEPWRERDALNLAPLGVQVAWAHAFLSDSSLLGLRGMYARSLEGSYQNDYDLSDMQSYVETTTQASTLGFSLFYGFHGKLNDVMTFRASIGPGYRRTTATVVSKLQGSTDETIVNGTVTGSAPIVEIASGASYRAAGIDWLGQLMVGIPLSVKTSTSGTFNAVQEVSEEDVKADIVNRIAPSKGMEISLALGITRKL